MQLRRTILKCLLASLGLAAVAGVLAVLLPTRDVMLKVMLTGLATAGAAVLMIGLSFLLDRRTLRPAGLYGMCAAVVEFVLWLVLIWLEPWMSGRVEERVAMTAVMVGVASVMLLVYLALVARERARLAGWAGVSFAVASLGGFLAAIWLPGRMWSRDEWWGTGWTFAGYGVIVFACLVGAGPAPRHLWRWAGAFLAAIGAGTVLVALWRADTHDDDLLRNICSLATSAACVVGLASLTLVPKLKDGQRWVRLGTIAAGAVTAVLINVFVIGERWADDDLVGRFASAAGIVTGCGSLALVVLAALNRRGAIEPSTASDLALTIVCPICRTKQSVPPGASACTGCGLRMEIRLEEPRCPQCDYLLYRLASDHCPECGAPVGRPA
ncbi:MAG: hypothetical protein ACYTG1_03765 [Planctomycetota bacterium]